LELHDIKKKLGPNRTSGGTFDASRLEDWGGSSK